MTDEPIDLTTASPHGEESTTPDPLPAQDSSTEGAFEPDPTSDALPGAEDPSGLEEDSASPAVLAAENADSSPDDSGTAEAAEDAPADGTDQETLLISQEELLPVIECLIFVADEPITLKQIGKVLVTVPEEQIEATIAQLVADYDARGSGLELRPVAGGWRFSTRPQFNDFIRSYHRSRPSARLSLPALETLAVIAYKQPVTVPEILEIRGVSSSSAIKTLLDKGLIETKGRKETVGRPMMYGTARKFLLQFGLSDLSELPSIEDFEDLVQ